MIKGTWLDTHIKQLWVVKHLANDWRHSWYTYDAFVGVRMTSLPVFRQTFGYPSLIPRHPWNNTWSNWRSVLYIPHTSSNWNSRVEEHSQKEQNPYWILLWAPRRKNQQWKGFSQLPSKRDISHFDYHLLESVGQFLSLKESDEFVGEEDRNLLMNLLLE